MVLKADFVSPRLTGLPRLSLSPTQEHLWAVARNTGRHWFIQGVWRIEATAAEVATEAEAALRRHEALRTVVFHDPALELPVQVVVPPSPAQLQVSAGNWRAIATADLARATAADTDGVSIMTVVELPHGEAILVITADQLVSDEDGLGLVAHEIAAAAARGTETAPPATQLADLAAWHSDWLDDPDHLAEREGWRRRRREWPSGSLVEPVILGKPAVRQLRLSDDVWHRLAELATQLVCDPEDLLLIAFATVAGRLAGTENVLVSLRTSGRDLELLSNVVAPLRRDLPVSIGVGSAVTAGDAVSRLQQDRHDVVDDGAHADPRTLFGADPTQVRLPRVAFEVRNRVSDPALSELQPPRTHRADLALIVDTTEQPVLSLAVSGPDAEAGLYLSYLNYLLSAMLQKPETPLRSLRLTARDEVPAARAVGPRQQPSTARFEQLVLDQATATPDRVAVRDAASSLPDGILSYGQLSARVGELADRLRASGIGPGDLVPVIGRRSWSLVVGFLGVLEAGAAYVPMDTNSPAARIDAQLSDVFDGAGAGVVVLGSAEDAAPAGAGTVLLADTPSGELAAIEPGRRSGGTAAATAYVLYTSGTTGRPAGVVVPHTGLVNYTRWAAGAYGAERGAVVHTSPGFDLTVTSMLTPLIAGGTVTVVGGADGVTGLIGALRGAGGLRDIGIIKLTPTHLRLLTQLLRPEDITVAVGVLVIGGEALAPELAARARELFAGSRLINEYGPTETVVGSTFHELTDADSATVAIGRPISDTVVAVVADGEVAPVGVIGEIYLAGRGVANGYLRRPELTAQRFVEHDLGTSAELNCYRTGDLGRLDGNGLLHYLGRIDDQIKVRGYRVAPAEIEAVLTGLPGVAEAAVAAVERTPVPGQRGIAIEGNELVAFVVAAAGAEPDPAQLREACSELLPDAMVPSSVRVVQALPVGASGKLDLSALLAATAAVSTSDAEYAEPRTQRERVLVEAIQEVLGSPAVGIDDDYFRIGGDSIRSVMIVSKVQRRGMALSVSDIQRYRTVREIVASNPVNDDTWVKPGPFTPYLR